MRRTIGVPSKSLWLWVTASCLPAQEHREQEHQPAAPTAVEVELHRTDDASVGDMREDVAFASIADRWRELRSFGERSVAATDRFEGRDFVFVLDWKSGAENPAALIWFAADGERRLHAERPAWKEPVPGFSTARVDFGTSLDPSVPLVLQLRVQNGAVFSAQWVGTSCFGGRFRIGDTPYLVRCVDGDFDGELRGPLDRWVAGPEATLRRLDFANPGVEMRRLDEPWCLGSHTLRLRSVRDARAILTAEAPSDRSLLLARHLDRVQRETTVRFPARALMLKARGEDPDRPVAVQAVSWRCVTSMDAARAYAKARSKPLLVDFTALDCGWCRIQTHLTLPDVEVNDLLSHFACVKYVSNFDPARQYEAQGVEGFPCTMAFDARGDLLGAMRGFHPPSPYAASLTDWIERARR